MKLAAGHQKTLRRIMGNPVPADMRWSEIEALFRALGAEISEGSGSRVRVALGGVRAVFHRPHPSPETKRSAVRSVRDFLLAAGLSAKGDFDA
ncbi:MAG: hexulose-6-phosphate isomerase [Alphaproteobacteria bacterium PA4]|nr:MAG: hexulose-6-phosphate isomerase [Alphaproteobacteria bacterium PA4]